MINFFSLLNQLIWIIPPEEEEVEEEEEVFKEDSMMSLMNKEDLLDNKDHMNKDNLEMIHSNIKEELMRDNL